jgi:formylmethanofuran dehydrogenase subunit E
MALATFFDQVPPLRLHDGLAELLGASDDGIIEYRYVDAVRLAGHSCPTVAGAWLSARAGLAALYPSEMPERGGISVFLPEAEDAGVTGVIGQVLTLVTGAAAANGFHGLAGRHRRSGLLHYAVTGVAGVRLRREDTGDTVEVQYDPRGVGGDPEQRTLMNAVLAGNADADQTRRFGELWQERVRRVLLEHADDPRVVRVRHLATPPQAEASAVV